MTDKLINEKLTDVITRTRKAKGLTQQELADMCGLEQSALSKIEREGLCSFKNLDKICEALNIKIKIEVDMGSMNMKKTF